MATCGSTLPTSSSEDTCFSDASVDDSFQEQASLPNKQCTQGDVQIVFVKQPPREIQLECSICLQFLSDPCLVDCECGNSFCRDCIETVKQSYNPCPLCNQNFKIVLSNKQLKRTLNGLLVYCPHRGEGCSWADELGKLSEHFNETPTEDTRLGGCELISISCKFCRKSFPRRDIPSHEAELCPDKPYTCQFCGHSSVFNDITDNHWPVCLKYPLPCPFECGESPQREHLESHVASECGSATIECDFLYAGCEVEIPRREMPAHLRESAVEHMSLLALKHKESVRVVNAMKVVNKSLRDENQSLKARVAEVWLNNESLQNEVNLTNLHVKALEHLLSSALPRCNAQFPPPVSRLPLQLTLHNVKHLKQSKITWNSAPFYTSARGYKMLLSVRPFGCGDGYGTHMSLYVYIIRGEFDHELEWPFRGEVTVTMVSQWMERHFSGAILFDEYQPEHCSERRYSNQLTGRLGWDCFIRFRNLYPEYIRDDCVIFEITYNDEWD